MVVKHGGSFVKSAGVWRSSKSEFLAIEVMAKLVAKRAQERAKRRDLLAHGGASPYADHLVRNRVVAEKFRLPPPLPDAKGSSGQRTDLGSPHPVKGGCRT